MQPLHCLPSQKNPRVASRFLSCLAIGNRVILAHRAMPAGASPDKPSSPDQSCRAFHWKKSQTSRLLPCPFCQSGTIKGRPCQVCREKPCPIRTEHAMPAKPEAVGPCAPCLPTRACGCFTTRANPAVNCRFAYCRARSRPRAACHAAPGTPSIVTPCLPRKATPNHAYRSCRAIPCCAMASDAHRIWTRRSVPSLRCLARAEGPCVALPAVNVPCPFWSSIPSLPFLARRRRS